MGALIYLIASPLFWAFFVLAAIIGAALHKIIIGSKKKPTIPPLRIPSVEVIANEKISAAPQYSRQYAEPQVEFVEYPARIAKKKH